MRYMYPPPALDAPQTAPQIAVPQPTAQYGRDGPAGIRGRGPEHQRKRSCPEEMPAHKNPGVGMTPQMQRAAGKFVPAHPQGPIDPTPLSTAGGLLTLCIKGETGPIREGGGCVGPATTTNERVNIHAIATRHVFSNADGRMTDVWQTALSILDSIHFSALLHVSPSRGPWSGL